MSSEVLVLRDSIFLGPNRGRDLTIVAWVLISLSAVVVFARCCAKWKHARKLFYDDALMALALVNGVAYTAFVQLAVNNGYGKHMNTLAKGKMTNTVLYGAISMLFGALSPMAGRVSFCSTLIFLIKTDPRMAAWPLYLCIFLQLLINVTWIIIVFTKCGKNLNVLWHESEGQLKYQDYCQNPDLQTYMKYFVGSWNTATDFYLAIVPAVLVCHTRVSRKEKFGLGSLLCLSSVAMVASGVKTYEATVLQAITDYTWALVPYTLCTSIELNIIMVASSVPLLRPLFHKQKPPQRTLRGETWSVGRQISLASIKSSQLQQSWSGNISESNLDSCPCPSTGRTEGITVTTEIDIDISYRSRDAPAIHASLIGLSPNSDQFAYPEAGTERIVPIRRWWKLT